jgi:hypothetical protein
MVTAVPGGDEVTRSAPSSENGDAAAADETAVMLKTKKTSIRSFPYSLIYSSPWIEDVPRDDKIVRWIWFGLYSSNKLQ